MSSRFILSAPASNDLEEILTYVVEKSGWERGERVARRFYEAFTKLADNPALGHRREDLTNLHVLFFAVWSWLVIYRADKRPLEVVRVIHGARDVEALLREEIS